MSQQNNGAFGHANVTPLTPEINVKEEKKEEKFDEDISLEEALSTL